MQSLPKDVQNKEALTIIDNIISETNRIESLKITEWYYTNELKRIAKTIRKDIPIKPEEGLYCPTCKMKLDRVGGLVDDCLYCGQKIDWENK